MIFIVDDNFDDFFITKRILRSIGFNKDIKHFPSGEKLINHIKNLDSSNFPKIIFLDINMPKDSGKFVLKTLKSNEHTKNLVIIILSTSMHKKDIDECLMLKADAYIQKSIHIDEMAQSFKQVLQKFGIKEEV